MTQNKLLTGNFVILTVSTPHLPAPATLLPTVVRTAADLGRIAQAQRIALGLRQIDLAGIGNTGNRLIVDIEKGKIRHGVTLPIGPLRLIDMSGGSISTARKLVDEYLDNTPVIERLKGRNFYAVGGTWRSLARIHMAQTHYPLHVLHHYTISREQARSVADLVAGLSASSLKDIKAVSRSRSDSMIFFFCLGVCWLSSFFPMSLPTFSITRSWHSGC